jgi:hypothetical protein
MVWCAGSVVERLGSPWTYGEQSASDLQRMERVSIVRRSYLMAVQVAWAAQVVAGRTVSLPSGSGVALYRFFRFNLWRCHDSLEWLGLCPVCCAALIVHLRRLSLFLKAVLTEAGSCFRCTGMGRQKRVYRRDWLRAVGCQAGERVVAVPSCTYWHANLS